MMAAFFAGMAGGLIAHESGLNPPKTPDSYDRSTT